MAAKQKIIGLTEKVLVYGQNKKKNVVARIDTGATKSSIDVKLAAELQLGPIYRTKLVKSTHGNTLRPVVEMNIRLSGVELRSDFTIADRTDMKYQILVGQNILKEGNFLVNPKK